MRIFFLSLLGTLIIAGQPPPAKATKTPIPARYVKVWICPIGVDDRSMCFLERVPRW